MSLTRGRKVANFLLSPFTALILLVASLEGEYFLNQSWNFLLTQVLALLTLVSITIDIRRRIPLRIAGKARMVAAFTGLLLLFLGLSYSLFWKLTSSNDVAFEGTAVLTLLYGASYFIVVIRKQRKLKSGGKTS